jgi:hypothetical protein
MDQAPHILRRAIQQVRDVGMLGTTDARDFLGTTSHCREPAPDDPSEKTRRRDAHRPGRGTPRVRAANGLPVTVPV